MHAVKHACKGALFQAVVAVQDDGFSCTFCLSRKLHVASRLVFEMKTQFDEAPRHALARYLREFIGHAPKQG